MASAIRSYASISFLELVIAALALMAAATALTLGASGSLQDEDSIVQFDDDLS
jgi:hypothetical protein